MFTNALYCHYTPQQTLAADCKIVKTSFRASFTSSFHKGFYYFKNIYIHLPVTVRSLRRNNTHTLPGAACSNTKKLSKKKKKCCLTSEAMNGAKEKYQQLWGSGLHKLSNQQQEERLLFWNDQIIKRRCTARVI